MSTLPLSVTLAGHSRIDFDRRPVRRAMRKVGAEVRKDARRMVARRAISAAGQYPGRNSGALYRSIKARVSRSGFMVVVRPEKTPQMDEFYPAYLWYGVTGRARRKDHRAQPKDGRWRIAPRRNYMTDALDARRGSVQETLRATLLDSLKPR